MDHELRREPFVFTGRGGEYFRIWIVNLCLSAHLLAILLDALGYVALLTRMAVNLNKFEKKILDALLVNHWASEESDE